ncbi:transposase [Psychrobacillus sp. NPDC093180]|uniref:transposase n=1 Tax=Psychrobacillus sp. NPDC093180 TaxID=3364489 RepID=UPI0037F2CD42
MSACLWKRTPLAKIGQSIGIDVGLTEIATLSDGMFISSLKAMRHYEHQLDKAQRVLSRRIERAKREAQNVAITKVAF